jgi:tetratricopeptide (TPR) repeat protein
MTQQTTNAEQQRTLLEARALALDAVAFSSSAPDRARRLCDAALARAVPLGLSDVLADILRWNGSIHRDCGNLVEAEGCYNHSLSVANASTYPAGRAHALLCLGGLAQLRGDLDRAKTLYHEAALLAEDLEDRHLAASIEQNLGIIAGDQGRSDEAAVHFRQALAALEGTAETTAVMWLLNNLGVLHKRDGLPHRAMHELDRALNLAVTLGDVRSEGLIEENRSAVHLMLGDLAEAERAATHAYEIAERRGDSLRVAAALHALASVRARQGSGASELIAMLERAVRLINSADDVALLAEVLLDLGDRYRDAGQLDRADEMWERARTLADRWGMRTTLDAVAARARPPGRSLRTRAAM